MEILAEKMTCEWPDGSGGARPGLLDAPGRKPMEASVMEAEVHRNEEMKSDKWEKHHPEER